jgi:hypothetical protein
MRPERRRTWRGATAVGRAAGGPVPHGHGKATTFVAGLTSRGFVAPQVTDGAMNGASFRGWVEPMLAPELRPGDIVIMDNPAAHPVSSADLPPGDPAAGRMVGGVAEAIAARGAELH